MINLNQKIPWTYFFFIPIALIGGYFFVQSLFICSPEDFSYGKQCFGIGLGFTLYLLISVPVNVVIFLLGMLMKKQRADWLLNLILAGLPIIFVAVLWLFEK